MGCPRLYPIVSRRVPGVAPEIAPEGQTAVDKVGTPHERTTWPKRRDPSWRPENWFSQREGWIEVQDAKRPYRRFQGTRDRDERPGMATPFLGQAKAHAVRGINHPCTKLTSADQNIASTDLHEAVTRDNLVGKCRKMF
jgi:hypothetical protein